MKEFGNSLELHARSTCSSGDLKLGEVTETLTEAKINSRRLEVCVAFSLTEFQNSEHLAQNALYLWQTRQTVPLTA